WFLFFTTEGTEERRGIVFSQPVHSIVPLSKMRLYFDRLWNQPLSSMLMIQVFSRIQHERRKNTFLDCSGKAKKVTTT
ncbi:MAG: hypothetical protein ACP5MG_13105, partial [Verrucomicrobiia bacterium]